MLTKESFIITEKTPSDYVCHCFARRETPELDDIIICQVASDMWWLAQVRTDKRSSYITVMDEKTGCEVPAYFYEYDYFPTREKAEEWAFNKLDERITRSACAALEIAFASLGPLIEHGMPAIARAFYDGAKCERAEIITELDDEAESHSSIYVQITARSLIERAKARGKRDRRDYERFMAKMTGIDVRDSADEDEDDEDDEDDDDA